MAEWQCAAIGGLLLWARWSSHGQLSFVVPLADLFDQLGWPAPIRYLIELFLFLSLGTFIALQIVGVQGCKEAFMAGVGWTGFASQVRPRKRIKNRNIK